VPLNGAWITVDINHISKITYFTLGLIPFWELGGRKCRRKNYFGLDILLKNQNYIGQPFSQQEEITNIKLFKQKTNKEVLDHSSMLYISIFG